MANVILQEAVPSREHRGRARRRLSRLGAFVVLVTVGAMAVCGTPAVGSAAHRAARARWATPLHLTFDRHDTLRAGSPVHNANGRAVGTVLVAKHGRLTLRRGHPGRAAQYPCRRCGRAIIEVPSRRPFNPGVRTFAFGATVKLGRARAGGHGNVVQKGYYQQPGGQYKLQIMSGVPGCVVHGNLGRVIATAKPTASVANGAWHRVVCLRTARGVVLRVDGKVRARAVGPTGRLRNKAPVRVGGKNLTASFSAQYHGRLDDVFLRVYGCRGGTGYARTAGPLRAAQGCTTVIPGGPGWSSAARAAPAPSRPTTRPTSAAGSSSPRRTRSSIAG